MNFTRALFLTGLSGVAFMGVAPSAQAAGYSNDYCREYTKTVTVGGRAVESYGTACLQPDGAWKIKGTNQRISAPPSVERVTYAAPRTAYRAPTNLVVVRQPVNYRPSYRWGNPHYKARKHYKAHKRAKHYYKYR